MADTTTPTSNTSTQPSPAVSAGQTLVDALLRNQQVNQAAGQAQAGIQNAIGSVQGMYGAQTALDLPFIEAGANAGNAMAANVQPYIGAGQNAIGNLQTLQGSPLNTQQFMDPSMQFAMAEGQKALERSAAARGGALSGAAMKDLLNYSQGLATQNYNNAAQLAMNDRSQRIGIGEQLYQGGLSGNQQMQPIYQGGVNALGVQGNAANYAGQNLSTLYQAGGQTAANYTGQQANTLSPILNAIGQIGTAAWNQYNQNNTGSTTAPPADTTGGNTTGVDNIDTSDLG